MAEKLEAWLVEGWQEAVVARWGAGAGAQPAWAAPCWRCFLLLLKTGKKRRRMLVDKRGMRQIHPYAFTCGLQGIRQCCLSPIPCSVHVSFQVLLRQSSASSLPSLALGKTMASCKWQSQEWRDKPHRHLFLPHRIMRKLLSLGSPIFWGLQATLEL